MRQTIATFAYEPEAKPAMPRMAARGILVGLLLAIPFWTGIAYAVSRLV